MTSRRHPDIKAFRAPLNVLTDICTRYCFLLSSDRGSSVIQSSSQVVDLSAFQLTYWCSCRNIVFYLLDLRFINWSGNPARLMCRPNRTNPRPAFDLSVPRKSAKPNVELSALGSHWVCWLCPSTRHCGFYISPVSTVWRKCYPFSPFKLRNG